MREIVEMRVAAVQAAQVWLDRAATIDVVTTRIEEASAGGADLVAFPETFVPGYPVWVDITNTSAWQDPDQQAAFAWYLDQSVVVDGPEFAQVVDACRDTRTFGYVGTVERSRSGGSVYCSLVAIHPDRGVVGVHRKLKPTYSERLVWADGDGAGLVAHDWAGATLTALNCWENWMPLARTAMYAQGAQIHVAAWPGSVLLTEDISRFIAREGRLFVISVGAVYRSEHIPAGFPLADQMRAHGDSFYNGGSMIVAPGGEVLARLAPGEEAILYADLDLARVARERQNFDPTGHYSRPDVLRVEVGRDRWT
jgi:nitrilase